MISTDNILIIYVLYLGFRTNNTYVLLIYLIYLSLSITICLFFNFDYYLYQFKNLTFYGIYTSIYGIYSNEFITCMGMSLQRCKYQLYLKTVSNKQSYLVILTVTYATVINRTAMSHKHVYK